MEDDEGEIYVGIMQASADEFRHAAKVPMDKLPGADDVAAAKIKTLTKLYLWLTDFLEEQKIRCLSDLETRH
ncbi:MAG: hypothetical protein O6829_10995 [Alphaproteobacteria bacterium]|nr:hypothetical protein [Alphaproteobacteria bacterium]